MNRNNSRTATGTVSALLAASLLSISPFVAAQQPPPAHGAAAIVTQVVERMTEPGIGIC